MLWTIHSFATCPLFKGCEISPSLQEMMTISCSVLTSCGPWFLTALNLWLNLTLIVVDSDYERIKWSPVFSQDLVNLLSSFINLRRFALQLQNTPSYILAIVSFFLCAFDFTSTGPQKYALPTRAKILPKLERFVLALVLPYATDDLLPTVSAPRIFLSPPVST